MISGLIFHSKIRFMKKKKLISCRLTLDANLLHLHMHPIIPNIYKANQKSDLVFSGIFHRLVNSTVKLLVGYFSPSEKYYSKVGGYLAI